MTTRTESEAAAWTSARDSMVSESREAEVKDLEARENGPTPEDDIEREQKNAQRREKRKAAKDPKKPDAKAETIDDGDAADQVDDDLEPKDDEKAKDGDKAKEGEAETPEQQQSRQLKAALRDARAKERATSKALTDKATEYETRIKNLERMLNDKFDAEPSERAAPAAKQNGAAPKVWTEEDVERDPLGYLKDMARRDAAWRAHDQRTAQQKQQSDQRQRQSTEALQRTLNDVSTYEQDFRLENPDYDAALDHAQTSRVNELKRMRLKDRGGNPLSDQALMQIAWTEGVQLARSAMEAGEDPAAALYETAKGRGYARKAQEPAQNEEDAEDKIERLRDNKRMGGNGAGGGGGSKSAIMTIEDVAAIEDEGERAIAARKYREQRASASRKNHRAAG